jgi:hypothetical protein
MKEFKLTLSSLGEIFKQFTMIAQSKNIAYRVTVKEWKETRSLSQNSMYWAWLGEINKQAPLQCDSKISGPEMWHEVFKKYYCPAKTVKSDKATLEVKSTKALDVGEMTFYLNKIEHWCMDRGVKLSVPPDSEYYKLMESQIE